MSKESRSRIAPSVARALIERHPVFEPDDGQCPQVGLPQSCGVDSLHFSFYIAIRFDRGGKMKRDLDAVTDAGLHLPRALSHDLTVDRNGASHIAPSCGSRSSHLT